MSKIFLFFFGVGLLFKKGGSVFCKVEYCWYIIYWDCCDSFFGFFVLSVKSFILYIYRWLMSYDNF